MRYRQWASAQKPPAPRRLSDLPRFSCVLLEGVRNRGGAYIRRGTRVDVIGSQGGGFAISTRSGKVITRVYRAKVKYLGPVAS